MIDKIMSIIFLPISVILFMNLFSWTDIQTIIGISIMLIAAIGLILIQAANITGAHIDKEHIGTSYILCGILIFPSIIYFLALGIAFPESITNSMPAIFASFLFIEGIYSFYF